MKKLFWLSSFIAACCVAACGDDDSPPSPTSSESAGASGEAGESSVSPEGGSSQGGNPSVEGGSAGSTIAEGGSSGETLTETGGAAGSVSSGGSSGEEPQGGSAGATPSTGGQSSPPIEDCEVEEEARCVGTQKEVCRDGAWTFIAECHTECGCHGSPRVCNSHSLRCYSENIQQCEQDGSGWRIIRNCRKGENPYCAMVPNPECVECREDAHCSEQDESRPFCLENACVQCLDEMTQCVERTSDEGIGGAGGISGEVVRVAQVCVENLWQDLENPTQEEYDAICEPLTN